MSAYGPTHLVFPLFFLPLTQKIQQKGHTHTQNASWGPRQTFLFFEKGTL